MQPVRIFEVGEGLLRPAVRDEDRPEDPERGCLDAGGTCARSPLRHGPLRGAGRPTDDAPLRPLAFEAYRCRLEREHSLYRRTTFQPA